MTTPEEDLFAELEEGFAAVLEEGVEDLTKLSIPELLDRLVDATEDLQDRRELYADNGEKFGRSTAEGREIQGDRAAILIELNRRNAGK